MFRTAELGQKLPRKDYKIIEPQLRQELLVLQRQLREAGNRSVIIVFAGVDGAGKGATVTLLNEWMDARWLINRAYTTPSDEERERPEYWRFWRDLPPRGQIGLYMSSWYSRPALDYVHSRISLPEFDECIDRIIGFEDELAVDGTIIIKLWMHLSKKQQKKRLRALENDPLLSWQVSSKDWDHWQLYDRFIESAERLIMRSNTGHAPWSIVEGIDPCYRAVSVGTIIRDELERRVAEHSNVNGIPTGQAISSVAEPPSEDDQESELPARIEVPKLSVLSQLDMSRALAKKQYSRQLKEAQARLSMLERKAVKKNISTIAVFEGPDAAGKGGAIRRVIGALDPHTYRVLPFAAPTEEERAQHYLWRFWRRLSRAGHVTIFDRSWYGRVLVERVEGFADEEEWRRAYAEINAFEEQLIEHGIVLVKYWVHISKDEQLRRFQEREETPHKQWKLTDEDWRNHAKWEEYEIAAHDMVQYTSTHYAPWELIEGNDKRFARIKILGILCDNLEAALER